ncbi:Spherulation-specific family 4 [Dendryphion nanum]|uniref:Spherulation-specific family 4 n=1 Tax=Dendryphion nanum TaxID=256645 RepID=A0A9P9I6E3_9PLEO|nr:Spherulation-specific family 4 [Dendryphion nanum]
MSILLPLYVYPHSGAWDPLFAAAKAHPDVEFTTIINPCSGPCLNTLPDTVYLSAIPKLRSYPNIRTLGYVATNYTAKDINTVISEIDTYANWPKMANNTKLKVDGIFFDETPSVFEKDKYEYLERASRAVKNGTRFRDRFVVHNPGNIPPSLLMNSNALATSSYLNLSDITVVFEEKFDRWLNKATFDALQSHKVRRSKLAVILHSIPNLSKKVLDFVVEQVEEAADWVFLTDIGQKDEYYHSFSGFFSDLVEAVDRG